MIYLGKERLGNCRMIGKKSVVTTQIDQLLSAFNSGGYRSSQMSAHAAIAGKRAKGSGRFRCLLPTDLSGLGWNSIGDYFDDRRHRKRLRQRETGVSYAQCDARGLNRINVVFILLCTTVVPLSYIATRFQTLVQSAPR